MVRLSISMSKSIGVRSLCFEDVRSEVDESGRQPVPSLNFFSGIIWTSFYLIRPGPACKDFVVTFLVRALLRFDRGRWPLNNTGGWQLETLWLPLPRHEFEKQGHCNHHIQKT
jgi:hypothetical protein